MDDERQFVSALQTVISPVVLISGVGLLLLSMTNRFGHASNRLRTLVEAWRSSQELRSQITPQIRILNRRLHILVIAIALGLGCVLLTSLLIVTLFAGYLFGINLRGLVVCLFALSLATLVTSLALFIGDMTLAFSGTQRGIT